MLKKYNDMKKEIFETLDVKFREHFPDIELQTQIHQILYNELIDIPQLQDAYPDINSLYHAVLSAFNVPFSKQNGTNRERLTVAVRSFFWYKCREIFGSRYSLVTIAKYLRYDHTTVIHALRSIKEKLEIKDHLVCSLFEKWENFNKNKFGNTNN